MNTLTLTLTRRTALVALVALVALGAIVTTALGACKKSDAGADIPEYGSVGSFSLTDQTGKPFGSAELAGKVWVAAFMFTRCPTICPVLTARMKSLQDQSKARNLELHFVSISVDPENDTPQVLAAYAQKHGADPARWHFLTGNYDAIKQTSVQGFKTALEGKADPNQEHYGILHGSHLILVDAAGRLRGFYGSKDEAALENLLTDATRLSK